MRLLALTGFFLASVTHGKLLGKKVVASKVRDHDHVTGGIQSGIAASVSPADFISPDGSTFNQSHAAHIRGVPSGMRTIHVDAQHVQPSSPESDGYADTDDAHPRFTPPKGDPVGDGKGWGPDAAQRSISPAGEQPENFSLLDKVLGPCGTCTPWTPHCSIGFVVSALLMVWTFKNLKVMSDVYFVPSTIALSKRLGIPADVAGATLLAFGSSAPEFCTNLVASLFIVNECGVGDIVGSAIHNILLIIGVSGLFAGRVLSLWWYPLSRDCFFYCVSVIELAVFLWDEHLQIWEATIMVCTYFAYCVWMVWNLPIYNNLCAIMKLPADVPDEGDDEDDDADGILYYDPAEALWRHTMPPPGKSSLSCFLQALCHISWLSYIMVDAATRFGNVVGIPSLFMGLVFLAAGTSIPDAFASMAAARKGEGDMAVSNALGSNIFDILLGLGLPWLISLMLGRPVVFLGVNRLLYWVAVLVGTLAAFMVVVVGSGFKLGYKMGLILVSTYGLYVVWALLKSFRLVA